MGQVSNAALASPKRLFIGTPSTSHLVVYNAPTASTNVPSDCATAIIKDIIIGNTTSMPAQISLVITDGTGTTTYSWIFGYLSIGVNETKSFSKLNITLKPGQSLTLWQTTANALTMIISGVEVQ